MTNLIIVPRIETLDEDEWPRLRKARLTALKEAPDAFLSSYKRELRYGEEDWRAEFSRGEWTLMTRYGRLVGLIGATREVATPPSECYLEYLWVSPEFRRSGVASDLIKIVLKRLIKSGVTTVWLWILEGNEPARRLYEGLGFVSANKRQPLPDNPSRHEELMRLDIHRRPLRQTSQDDDFRCMRTFVEYLNPEDALELRPVLRSGDTKEGSRVVKISLWQISQVAGACFSGLRAKLVELV
jgi:ribosomal protein S18 acetylase RimI-like enzyme